MNLKKGHLALFLLQTIISRLTEKSIKEYPKQKNYEQVILFSQK